MKKLLLIIILNVSFFIPNSFCFAGSNKIDSLQIILKSAKEDISKVNLLNNLSWEMIENGNNLQADSIARMAINTAEKLNYIAGLADSYNYLGIMYAQQGNYPEALKNYFAALKIKEKIGKKDQIASVYSNIGIIYDYQAEYDKALGTYLAALTLMKEIPYKRGIAYCYNNIGIVYQNQGKLKEALENYFLSLKMNAEIGDKQAVAANYNNIGVINKKQGDYSEAWKNLKVSLKISEEIKDKKGVACSYINLGGLAVKLNKLGVAKEYLNKGLGLSKEIGNKEKIKDAYNTLSVMDSITGNYNAAYEDFKNYTAYRDSLFSEKNTKKAVQAEMNFYFEKKQAAEKLEQEKKEALLLEEMNRQKIIRSAVTFGFVILLLLALIMFRGYKQKQKVNKELASKNDLIGIQKIEVEQQKFLLEEKNKEISDSISYAKRIQSSFLTSEKYISHRLCDNFILFNPRDVVSGDFYWMQEKNKYLYMCTADCTGHGIPGAFMSLIGMGILNEIIFSKSGMDHTDEIFNELRRIIILAVNPEGASEEGNDGMDAVLLRFDFQKMELEYSAANNSFYIIRAGNFTEYKPDKMPVGNYIGVEKPFTSHTIALQKGDCIYTFSDGFADQFGGLQIPDEKLNNSGQGLGKKFKYKQLQELLTANYNKPMELQKEILNKTFETWKGSLDQVDDVLVIGIRV